MNKLLLSPVGKNDIDYREVMDNPIKAQSLILKKSPRIKISERL